ncbi:MAG: protein translocase subunit SecD [Fimbriimonadaceae bacterium]|nr:protein translocase subunit SecD [Fimbriimonadaceae bacterium]
MAGLSWWLHTIRPVSYGLDVSGGVRFTYQMDTSRLTQEQRTEIGRIRENLVKILFARSTGSLGVAEPNIQTKGTDQFIVELPGLTDIDMARAVMSTTARIEMYHAKNVSTRQALSRPYTEGSRYDDKGAPYVSFTKRSNPEKELKPGDPEYTEMIKGWGDPIVSGEDIIDARPEIQGGNKFVPLMRYSDAGSRKMEQWSRRFTEREENVAIVLDGKVLSIAPLQRGAILRDNSIITGDFSTEYVRTLTDLVKSGSLPVDLSEIRSEKVDPTIGKAALDQILKAGVIAFAIIAVFVVVYYVFPGIVALVALLLYVLFTMTTLQLMSATFSLAAIAGFILSIGMAVDANILVFERVKEELREGRTLQSAIDIGFKRALSAIVDSNACTILTSLVLVMLGSGPVKGFATTLIVGVVISLFTAVVITRSLLQFLVGSGLGANPKWYGLNRQWFGEGLERDASKRALPIISKRNLFFVISVLTIIPGLIFMGMGGLKPNVEFTGGLEGGYKLTDYPDIKSEDVAKRLDDAGVKGGNIKFAYYTDEVTKQETRIMYLNVPVSGPLKDLETPQQKRDKVTEIAGFKNDDVASFTEVGPSVAEETKRSAILGVIFSALLIIVYLAIRFGVSMGGFNVGLRFSSSAIGALVHDIMVVIGLAAVFGSIFGWEVSALFITAMLTVIGFSTHDTIVIFDRIRENLRKGTSGENLEGLIDRSITQSIARSINTSSTVIVTLIILIWFGSATPELRFFNVIMLCGIVSGTYSSIWNASPILYVIDRWIMKRSGEKAGLMAIATEERQKMRMLAQQASHTTVDDSSAGYGQVKRKRTSVSQQGRRDLDEDE